MKISELEKQLELEFPLARSDAFNLLAWAKKARKMLVEIEEDPDSYFYFKQLLEELEE